VPDDTFAARLDAVRLRAGLSWGELARRAGLSRDGVRKLARGEREPSWGTVQAVADALGVSTEELRGRPTGAAPTA
jgi:transcriptional regulator with XRE-family HTH domain